MCKLNLWLQTIMQAYPLWTCGFLNNRIVSFSILYSVTLLGFSKMILLINPMVYHAANHELIVKCFLSFLAIYFVQDTIVVLTFGNIYYCHSDTMLRVAALYNMTVDEDLVRAQKISGVHNIADVFCVLSMVALEIIINSINYFQKGKKIVPKKIAQLRNLRKRLIICKTTVENIEMGRLAQSRRIAWADDTPIFNIVPAPPVVVGSNPENNSRDSSNRNYLLICVFLYLNIIFVRFQNEPEAKHLHLALLCWRVYGRQGGTAIRFKKD